MSEMEFVGRRSRLDALDRGPWNSGARVLVVAGAEGSGRTRLVRHWLSRNSGAYWLGLRAPVPACGAGGLLPELLYAWLKGAAAARSGLTARAGELVERHHTLEAGRALRRGLPFLLHAIGAGTDERPCKLAKLSFFGELVDGFRGLLACLARDALDAGERFTLQISDFDLADGGSADLLDRALYGISEKFAPRIVVTAKDPRRVQSRFRYCAMAQATLNLAPFTDAEAAAFARAAGMDESRTDTMMQRTGGLPLALKLFALAGGAGGDTLDTLSAAAMEALPAPEAALLRRMSAFGMRFTSPLGAEESALRRSLQRQSWLAPDDEAGPDCLFTHPALWRAARHWGVSQARQAAKSALAVVEGAAKDSPRHFALLALRHAVDAEAHLSALESAALCATDCTTRGLFATMQDVAILAENAILKAPDSEPANAARARVLLALARMQLNEGEAAASAATLRRLPDTSGLDFALRTQALCAKAESHVLTGAFGDCQAQIESAVAQAPAQSLARADLLNALGVLLRRTGRQEAARQALFAAHEMFEKQGEASRAALSMHLAAKTYISEARYETAELLVNDALARLEKSGDRSSLAALGLTLGVVRASRGDLGGAQSAWEKALEHFQALGAAENDPVVRLNLAEVAHQRGDGELARRQFAELLQGATSRGHGVQKSSALIGLARVDAAAGRLEQAVDSLLAALASLRELKAELGVVSAEAELARLYAELGRRDEAARLAQAALEVARTRQNLGVAAVALGALAACEQRAGNPAKAFELLKSALENARNSEVIGGGDDPATLSRLSLQLARMVLDEGLPQAREAAHKALLELESRLSLRVAGGGRLYEPDLGEARALLSKLA